MNSVTIQKFRIQNISYNFYPQKKRNQDDTLKLSQENKVSLEMKENKENEKVFIVLSNINIEVTIPSLDTDEKEPIRDFSIQTLHEIEAEQELSEDEKEWILLFILGKINSLVEQYTGNDSLPQLSIRQSFEERYQDFKNKVGTKLNING